MTEKLFPELKTQRLLLRRIDDSDKGSVLAGLSDPRVYATCAVSYHSMEEVQVQMDWYRQLIAEGTGICWAICDSASGNQFCGVCGFSSLDPAHCRAEIGYWLLHEYWGMGFATEAVSAIVNFGFHHLNLHRIGADVDVDNPRSSRLMEKVGFQFEGLRRGCELKNGVFIDLKCYSKLATDVS